MPRTGHSHQLFGGISLAKQPGKDIKAGGAVSYYAESMDGSIKGGPKIIYKISDRQIYEKYHNR